MASNEDFFLIFIMYTLLAYVSWNRKSYTWYCEWLYVSLIFEKKKGNMYKKQPNKKMKIYTVY